MLPPARDSSRHYSFTLLLPFLHHFSLQLHVGVLVKHRLLGMTGGREPSILYCHSEGAAFSAATEESPHQNPFPLAAAEIQCHYTAITTHSNIASDSVDIQDRVLLYLLQNFNTFGCRESTKYNLTGDRHGHHESVRQLFLFSITCPARRELFDRICVDTAGNGPATVP